MFSTAFNMVKDDALAQDLMHEAFLKAFRKIDSFTGEATFGSWLKRIVINQCLDWIKRKKIETVELKDYMDPGSEEGSWSIDPDISLNEIVRCIEELPHKCRNVVKLYLMEGYDHQEVAQILDISEVASRSQLSRGKSRLKELLTTRNYER
jgi:RNA polymerase sigma-70 factor (ECF subfamily)